MWKYILKRLGYFIPTIVGVSIITFTLVRLIPGDPVEIVLGQHATAEVVDIYRRQLGLDRPIYIQYIIWLKRMIKGDWGVSMISNAKVTYLIFHRFMYTVQLAIFSMAIVSSMGLLFGVIAAYKVGSKIDKGLRFLSIFGWSIPSFLAGLVLIYIFALRLKLFPAIGAGEIKHLILPAFTLSTWGVSYIGRMTRGSLLEIVGQDFVTTAQAKGLTRKRIWLKHILRNGLLPVVTMLGMQFGWFLGGSFIVETIFSFPGIGFLTTTSVLNRDYTVVQGAILFIAIIYCTTNLVVDILYAFLDPRIRYEKRV